MLQGSSGDLPDLDVGDHFSPSTVIGVIDYSSTNFKLVVASPLTAVSSGPAPEVAPGASAGQLAVATFDADNLSLFDSSSAAPDFSLHPAKMVSVADLIRVNLASPDLVILQGIQDSDGKANTSVADPNTTLDALRSRIFADSGNTLTGD